MIDLLWWHWAVLGFGFIMAELALPAFVLVWFGLGGFVVMAGLLLSPHLSLTGQLLIWALSSFVMMVLWFSVFKRGAHKILVGRSSASLVGEVGLIAETVAPFKAGKVRFQKPMVGSDLWSCTSHEEIIAGTRVRVVRVEGNSVVVKKLEG
ncbi:MAG: NfeD family protein [Alphaproteobacteria bacterium]|nr:NfeD family protein [Alphaproteobacteria bacterium]